MYKYEISGYYFDGEERKRFEKEIEAPDKSVAMKIALGELMWESSEYFNDRPVKLDCIHYECL